MANEGPTEVGSIIGYLIMDDSDWDATIDKAEVKSKELGKNSPTIRISVDNAKALGDLAATRAAEDRVDQGAKNISKSSKDAAGDFRPLLSAALLLGPALAPLSVVGASVLGGLTIGAASLLLAFLGVRNELKQDSAEALQYSAGLATLKSDLTQLEQQAAHGTLVPFNNAVKDANSALPVLSGEMREFGGLTGDAAEHLANGLISGFITLRPLLTDVIIDVDRGAVTFDRWTQSSGGITKFMDLARAELPEVGRDVGELLLAVGHLGAAFGSTGLLALNGIGLLSRLINTIPVNQLDHVATAVTLMFGAWKAYQILLLAKQGFDKVSESLGETVQWLQRDTLATQASADAKTAAGLKNAAFAVSTDGVTTALAGEALAADAAGVATTSAADAAAAAELTMSAALGPLGLLAAGIGIVAFAWSSSHTPSLQATQDVNDYTDALKADNGVIASNVQQVAAKKLADSGAIELAQKLKISTSDVTDALLVGGTAASDLRSRLQELVTAGTTYSGNQAGQTNTVNASAKAAQNLLNIINTQSTDLEKSTAKVKDLQVTYAALGLSLDGTALKVTDGSVDWAAWTQMQDAAKQAAVDNATQIAQTTMNLQFENDAAGLVTQAFKILDGGTLDVAQAQSALDSATLQVVTSLKTNKGSLDEHTQAGIDDRQAIEGAVAAMQAKATADAQASGSTEQATAQYKLNSGALLDQIGKLDGVNSAAYAYAQQLLDIKNIGVIHTEIELQTIMLNDIAGKGSATAGHHAAGGLITGPGSGVSDSIPAWLSDREYVMPAAVVNQAGMLPLLDALRTGGSRGIAGPAIGSPAAQAVRASYSTPAAAQRMASSANAGQQPVHVTIPVAVQIDGQTLATTNVEATFVLERRA